MFRKFRRPQSSRERTALRGCSLAWTLRNSTTSIISPLFNISDRNRFPPPRSLRHGQSRETEEFALRLSFNIGIREHFRPLRSRIQAKVGRFISTQSDSHCYLLFPSNKVINFPIVIFFEFKDFSNSAFPISPLATLEIRSLLPRHLTVLRAGSQGKCIAKYSVIGNRVHSSSLAIARARKRFCRFCNPRVRDHLALLGSHRAGSVSPVYFGLSHLTARITYVIVWGLRKPSSNVFVLFFLTFSGFWCA